MPRNKHKTAEQKVLEALKKHLKGGETLIIGVSGGPDSIFLLNCLLKFEPKVKIIVAHINHALRGIEADLDTEFVKDFAKKHSLPFHSTKIDIMALAKSSKKSIEETGREIRYKFFNKLFKKLKANYLLTAHHADDNLETILLNFIRGASLVGLSGMCEITTRKDGLKIFRPLLCVTKEEICSTLAENQCKFRIDNTNSDVTIPRNFLRHSVIPLLKRLNPNLAQTILKNAGNIHEIHKHIEKDANKWIEENKINSEENDYTFDLKSFTSLAHALQQEIIMKIYKKLSGTAKNITKANIDEVLSIINKNIGRKQKKLGKYIVEIKNKTFIIKP